MEVARQAFLALAQRRGETGDEIDPADAGRSGGIGTAGGRHGVCGSGAAAAVGPDRDARH